MASSGNKQYGLILPNKKFNINEVKRPSVFNADSDSDEGAKDMGTSDWIKKSFQKQAAQNVGIRRQTEIDIRKAIEQDPTVYKYDEIYDEIEKKKLEEKKSKKDEKRKPRYIQSLLKKAEARKIENERRIERQVQKEREAEGEEFKDKESFVTSAYKKKLEEFSKLEEEERRRDMLEEICDVSKQQDLGGFYRHLYKTTVAKDEFENKQEIKEEKKDDKNNEKDSHEVNVTNKKLQREKRQYRKRKSSESSSLEEGERNSDSDTSISSSASSSSESSSSHKSVSDKTNNENQKPASNKVDKIDQPSEAKQKKIDDVNEKVKKEVIVDDSKDVPSNKNTTDERLDSNKDDKLTVNKEEKPKINIWEKRTVGLAFEEALKRYFERKAERLAMHGN